MITKILIAILLAMIGLGIDVDRLRVTEFLRAPVGYLALVWVLSWIPGLSRLRNFHLNSRVLFLILFAAVMSSQAVSHIVDTEIPRLKVVFRFIYFVYVIIITSAWGARIPRLPLALGTVLLFTAFPYNWSLNWTYIMGTVRSLPLFLGLLYLFTDEKVFRKLSFRDPFTWLPVLILVSFTITNIYNENYILGAEWVLRLLSAFLLFQIVRVKSDEFDARSVMRLLLILAGVHGVYFLTSIAFGTAGASGLNYILAKRTHIAGVNTNDIAGYLIIILPLFPAMLLDGRERAQARMWPVWLIFIVALILLLVVKARAAWPVTAVSMLLLFFLLKRGNYSARARWAAGVGAIVLVLGALLVLFAARDTKILSDLLDSNTLRVRLTLWQLAARVLQENPLAGVGAQNLTALSSMPVGDWFPAGLREDPYFLKTLMTYIHSHNLLLQLWLDGGLVYMAAMIALFGLALGRMPGPAAAGPDTVLRIGAAVALIATLLQGFMNYHFMDYAGWFPVWFLMALLARPGRPPSREPAEDETDPTAGRVWLERGVVAFFLIMAAYLGFVVYNHSEALNSLIANRARGGRKNTILLDAKTPNQAAHAKRAEKYISRAVAWLPRDPGLTQLAGEIAYFQYGLTKDPLALQRADRRFRRCTELRPNASMCWFRGAFVLDFQAPEKVPEIKRLLEHANRLDPFRLREKGGHHRF